MRQTDQFHAFDSDVSLSRALRNMPQRCNYRSVKSYRAFKNGKEAVLDALYEMCKETNDLIFEYYMHPWNFAPGATLPSDIDFPNWEREVEKMLPKILRAARES
jgi:hypothetical protein